MATSARHRHDRDHDRDHHRGLPRRLPLRHRRARVWAAAAVAGCVALDLWAVGLAAGSEEVGSFATLSRISFAAGLAPAPMDVVESVPASDGRPDSPAPERTGGPRGSGSAAPRVVEKGDGRPRPVAIPTAALRTAATGRPVRFTIEMEGGLGVDPTTFARTVATVLTDPRGWQREDGVRFVPVSPTQAAKGAAVDVRITLASPTTTDRLCAPLATRGEVSCHNLHRVVLNLRRWQLGADAYGTDLAGYRTYLVNHEVGHGLGHGHAYCAGAGRVAPVMMQQTYGLKGCTAWSWPKRPSS